MPDIFGLYLVLTDPVAGYEACAEAAVEEGVRYLQLRMKKRSHGEVLEMARRLRSITAGSGTRFIVNDDVDIAAEAGADGVHLGQDDMAMVEARQRWPEAGKIFGLSTHNEEQELRAREVAPDYIGVGPCLPHPLKRGLIRRWGRSGWAALSETRRSPRSPSVVSTRTTWPRSFARGR